MNESKHKDITLGVGESITVNLPEGRQINIEVASDYVQAVTETGKILVDYALRHGS